MITRPDPRNPERTIIEGVGTAEMVNAQDVKISDVIMHQMDAVTVTAVAPLRERIRITGRYRNDTWTVTFNERRGSMLIRITDPT